jgi:hypothetical protein
MQWWNEFVDWLTSSDARPVLFNAAVLLVAIVVAGLLSAWIAKGALKGLISRTDREQKASAIAALVDAATEASVWNSLTPQEQVLSDRAVGQADILVRLLPIRGAGIAANWANHQLAEMKRNSATFGYQLDPAVAEFRDRLIEWQNSPSRARKIFQNDLERWRFETASPEQAVVADQDAWVAQQHHEQYTSASTVPTATQAFRADDAAPARDTTKPDQSAETGSAIPVGAFANRTSTGLESASPITPAQRDRTE